MLTVEPRDNGWSVFTFAKVEVGTRDKEGKTSKEYRALVARDGWRKLNDFQLPATVAGASTDRKLVKQF